MVPETAISKRHLLAVCICLVLITFQGTITVRLLPVYAVHLGADSAMAGLLVAFAFLMVTLGNITGGWLSDRIGTQLGYDAAAVAGAIVGSAAVTLPLPLLLGWLSDRAGRKRFLVMCYVLGASGLLLMIPALQPWHFWLAAALLAIAQASGGAAQAFVADLVVPQAIGRGMSLFNSTNLIAGIVGVGGAGYLMQIAGTSATLLLAACLPLVGIALLLYLRKAPPAADAHAIAEVPGTTGP